MKVNQEGMEMAKLEKVNDKMFNQMFEGVNGSRRVVCILDSCCVRYMVFENGKRKSRREFSNGQEAICFRNAEKALNK